MTLYEINKMAYKNAPNMENFEQAMQQIHDYLYVNRSNYYLLLNNENHYYTIFTFKDSCNEEWSHNDTELKAMTAEILDIARELGSIKDIVVNDNGAIEFWIEYNDDVCMFVLFDYSKGVIEV